MNQVFLLGAGFTRAVMEDRALLTDEIMPNLNLSEFPEVMEDYEKTFPDIEQFITELDLKCLRFAKNNISISKRITEIRDDIVEQIVEMFDVNALSVDSLASLPMLKGFIEIVPAHSTILTLNYDCVLDQGLYLSDRWSPGGGYYASSFPYGSDEGDEKNNTKDNILLLKLHGSCNFRDSSGNPEYPNIEVSERIFPGIHAHCNEPGTSIDKGPHVLVMSYLKIYHNGIMRLWRKALEALKDAEKLIIIGCSLREEDIFLKFALYHYGMKEETVKFAVDIVDVNKERCSNLEDKTKTLVAWPSKQEIKLYDNGLQSYLSEYKN